MDGTGQETAFEAMIQVVGEDFEPGLDANLAIGLMLVESAGGEVFREARKGTWTKYAGGPVEPIPNFCSDMQLMGGCLEVAGFEYRMIQKDSDAFVAVVWCEEGIFATVEFKKPSHALAAAVHYLLCIATFVPNEPTISQQ